MARNGSGTMALLAEMAPANTVSNSATVNSIMEDIADALTDSINKDGTKAWAANQSMGGFKLTSVGNGTAAGDAPNLAQLQTGVVKAASAVAGTADAIQVTFSPANTTWTSKETFSWVSGGANTVTAPTISKDAGVSSKTIKKGASAALAVGDTGASGYVCQGYYNGTDVILLNPAGGATAATDTSAGVVELATTTETLTGTDTSRAVTPDALAALWEQGSDVASSGTISLGEGGYFNITGTTTITDIDFATDKAGRKAWVKFAGALTLTHNASTLILPGGVNITTAAGDTACFVSEGSDVVRCTVYQKASGLPVVSPASGGMTSLGTITTTSGTSQTLSGLTLTNYKFLRLVCKAVSFTSIQALLVGTSSGDAVAMTVALANATRTFSGTIDIDLATGVFAACVADNSGASMVNGGSNSPFTTSSTAVYVSVGGGASFDAGSIIVYGVS